MTQIFFLLRNLEKSFIAIVTDDFLSISQKEKEQVRMFKLLFCRYLIKKEFKSMDCHVETINGIENHVHVLFMLDKKFSVAQVFKQVKGSVSHEINLKSLIPFQFAWQTGYGAFGVSESRISNVTKYIERQKEHHHGESFEEELSRYYDIFGVSKKERKLLL